MLSTWELIKNIVEEAKNMGRRIVFTNGCFDIIHAGHCQYLAEARRLGDMLIVGLNTDSSVRRLKGDSRPVNNQHDRACVLSALKPVDYVVLFDEDTPYNLIANVMPDVLVKGGDYSSDNIIGADLVHNNGGEVIVLKFVEGKSTTAIIERFMNKNS